MQQVNGKAEAGVFAPALATALLPAQLTHTQDTNPATSKAPLYAKLAKVYERVKYVQKDKRNSFHGYSYASEAAIKAELHEAFAECGLILLPPRILHVSDELRSGDKDKQTYLTTIRIVFTIADVESGATVDGEMYGRGVDNQDKGIYKALTGALKYMLTTAFLIATGDDPEADEGQPPRNDPARGKRSAPTTAPAPKPPQSQAAPAPSTPAAPAPKPWVNTGEMKAAFHDQRKRVGDFVYTQIMGQFSVRGPEDFRDVESAVKAYQRLCAQPNREVA